MRPFVILDRDGTIIYERVYLGSPDGVELISGAAQGLSELSRAGCGIVVATNQAGLARGYFSARDLYDVHARLEELLANEGVRLDGIYVCPHGPEEGCFCRKPRLGLLEQAQRQHGFNAQESFVIGDKAIDIEFGKAAGAKTFLVRTGYGAEVERRGEATPHYVVDDLVEAARIIGKLISPELAAI